MKQFSRTWWGQKFIGSLENFTDPARLGRGRSYARGGKIVEFEVSKGKIWGSIRGSINPYFGVYQEPRYDTTIAIAPISKKDWSTIIQKLATKASWVAKLLLNEVPEDIDTSFQVTQKHLLPHSKADFQTKCSCPDYYNPCKHIAGLCYRFAAELDEDPFLLFELRGLSREALQAELVKTPLGKALAAGLVTEKTPPDLVEHYYTEPQTVAVEPSLSLRDFWLGKQPLPERQVPSTDATVPGIVIKKQGDFPAFWHRDNSFIVVMEELYERVRTKNQQVF